MRYWFGCCTPASFCSWRWLLGLLARNLNWKKHKTFKWRWLLCCLVTGWVAVHRVWCWVGHVLMWVTVHGLWWRCICTVSVEMDEILLHSPALLEALCWTQTFCSTTGYAFCLQQSRSKSQSVIDFILLFFDFHKNQFTFLLLLHFEPFSHTVCLLNYSQKAK